MTRRYVSTFRIFSRAWETNGNSLETNEDGTFRRADEIITTNLHALEDAGATIISVQAQDILLDAQNTPTILTNYTVTYEGQRPDESSS